MKTKKVLQIILIGTMIMFLGMISAGRLGLLAGLALSLFVFWLCVREDLPYFTNSLSPLRILGQDNLGIASLSQHKIWLAQSEDAFICSGTLWQSESGWILISENLAKRLKPDELKSLVCFHSRWIDARFGFWTRLSSCLYTSVQNFLFEIKSPPYVTQIVAVLLTWLTILPGRKNKILQALDETPESQKKALARAFDRLKSYAVNIPTQTPQAFDFLHLHPQRPCRQLSNPYIRQLVGYEPI